ncbi:unnamed protein product, partial [Amoebophrya sp. A120]
PEVEAGVDEDAYSNRAADRRLQDGESSDRTYVTPTPPLPLSGVWLLSEEDRNGGGPKISKHLLKLT